MALNANEVKFEGGSNFKVEVLPNGVYPARVVQVVNVGLQPHSFNGEVKTPKVNLAVTYELSDEFLKDEEGNDLEDKPRHFSETFPFSNLKSDKAKSTLRYKALDPKEEYRGDWTKLIETPCNVTLGISDKGKNKILGVSSMRPKEAAKAPPLVNPAIVYDVYEPDEEQFKKLPNWIQELVKTRLDASGLAKSGVDLDDEIPFKEETSSTEEKEDW